MDKIVIASRNPAKIERYKKWLKVALRQIQGKTKVLSPAPEQVRCGTSPEPSLALVLGLSDLDIVERPEEKGKTAEENAEIKARFYAKKTRLPVLAEDEALYVDFLPEDQQPGVHIRRINRKDEVDDDKLLAHWEGIIVSVPQEKRTGKWHIAYCLALPNGTARTIVVDSPITFFSPSSKIKVLGWPMSSLQGPKEFGRPETELTEEERRQIEKQANLLITEKLRELSSKI